MILGATITVNGVSKHTYTDFGLYMLPPKIAHPTVKTKTIDIPGGDGSVDLMQYITNIPRYNNRTVEITLQLFKHEIYENKITDLSNFINGQKAQIVFDECIEYYFEGQCTVDGLTNSDYSGEVKITADCFPYKLSVQTVNEDYLWDPFNLENGVVTSLYIASSNYSGYSFQTINSICSTASLNANNSVYEIYVKRMPVEPVISVRGTNNVTMLVDNKSYALTAGIPAVDNTIPGFILTEGTHYIRLTTDGTYSTASVVTFSFRQGVF